MTSDERKVARETDPKSGENLESESEIATVAAECAGFAEADFVF